MTTQTKEQVWEIECAKDLSYTESALSAMDIWADIKGKEVAIDFFNDTFKYIEINGVLISNYFTPETEKIFEIYIQSKEK